MFTLINQVQLWRYAYNWNFVNQMIFLQTNNEILYEKTKTKKNKKKNEETKNWLNLEKFLPFLFRWKSELS